MKNFGRALKAARQYWLSLALAIGCSLGVAALWGANVAALYPVIETTLHGQSLQEWNKQRLEAAQKSLAERTADATVLKARIAASGDDKEKTELAFELDMLNAKIHVDNASIYSAQRLQPLFNRFLPAKPFATVVFIVTLVAIATAIKQFLMLANAVLVSSVSQSIARDVRCQIFDKSLALDRPGFNTYGISGFAAHITHSTDMLANGITNFYGGAITEPLRIFACLLGAWLISWRLTLASMIFAPLAAFLMLFLNRRIRQLSVRILSRSLGFHHVMLEVFNSLLTVQAYTMEDFERDRFRDSAGHIRRTNLLAQFYNSLASPVTELLGMGMLCTGMIVSGYLVINQETHIFGIPMSDKVMTLPLFTVFFGFLIAAADPLRKLSTVITGVNNGMAAANLLYPILDIESRLVESPNPKALPPQPREIVLRNVTFSYDGANNVLHDVNLVIPRGEHVALIGPNGGGKSTIVNLLCRFYDPQQGEVLIDDVSLRDVAIKELRTRIALVTQQTELFNETIMHNIRYGRWSATDEDCIAAAKLARADEFIALFPEGYQTIVGPNGQRLSGGQRQRIALARAFLRNAEILILDEATSQIDRQSEHLIHEALTEFGRGRTMIMITHRESTLSLATKVAKVEYGKLELVAVEATPKAA